MSGIGQCQGRRDFVEVANALGMEGISMGPQPVLGRAEPEIRVGEMPSPQYILAINESSKKAKAGLHGPVLAIDLVIEGSLLWG